MAAKWLDADPFLRVMFSHRDQLLQHIAQGTGLAPLHALLGEILTLYEGQDTHLFSASLIRRGTRFHYHT